MAIRICRNLFSGPAFSRNGLHRIKQSFERLFIGYLELWKIKGENDVDIIVNDNIICLGQQGEHLATTIIFNVLDFVEEYNPNADISIVNLRSGEDTPYQIPTQYVHFENGQVKWQITNIDTDVAGANGKCELKYEIDGKVVKSKVFTTVVHPGLVEIGARPNSTETWISQLNNSISALNLRMNEIVTLVERAERAATAAESVSIRTPYVGSNGNWWIWDQTSNSFVDSKIQGFLADSVRYNTTQSLSDSQKQQARNNIGAGTSNFSGSYKDLTDIPTISL